ncbi:hypothetical protein TPA0909_55010 [Streptomyces albus]|nr:hypothetical protein TPA0909_55010 [Streptomyces albus]
MTPALPGFDHLRVPVAEGVSLHAAVSGSGSPIVLLHGFPQTHLMWRHVAADLAADHTVICPDLRGYGESDKPAETDGTVYSKRTMAQDIVTLARELGHERFALAGHDRGALVAYRAGLDHPETITHLACLDVLPTADMWETMRGVTAAVGFHLFLMAQPPGLPERMIAADPDAFFGYFLDIWANDPEAVPADVRAAYLAACRAAVPSIVADYRASAGIDLEHDLADRATGEPAAHAGLRAPAGLGCRARLRRPCAVERLGTGSAALHRLLRPLHGRGGTGRGGQGPARPAGPLNEGRHGTRTGPRRATPLPYEGRHGAADRRCGRATPLPPPASLPRTRGRSVSLPGTRRSARVSSAADAGWAARAQFRPQRRGGHARHTRSCRRPGGAERHHRPAGAPLRAVPCRVPVCGVPPRPATALPRRR